MMLRFLLQLRNSIGWIYSRKDGTEISYALWSDVWICPNCGYEQNDWELTVDENSFTVRKPVCEDCNIKLKRSDLIRKKSKIYDPFLNVTRELSLQYMVRLAVKNNNRISLVNPVDDDLELINRIYRLLSRLNVPINELPRGVNTEQPMKSHNFTHLHDFYTTRNLFFIEEYLKKARGHSLYSDLLFALTSVIVKTASKLHTVGLSGGINLAGQSPNTLHVPSTGAERNLFQLIENKVKDLQAIYAYPKISSSVIISTSATQDIRGIPSSSIDYIFTDPPFGANINYSEVSYLYEAWLGLYTNIKKEAIVNRFQDKGIQDYEGLMKQALNECYRVLKAGRWITVEFHNSANSIWNAIQNALGEVGFVLADVRVFDKGQGTWKQMTTSGAVKQDLIITAYKPHKNLEDRFKLEAGTEKGAWDFVSMHLKQLPVFVSNDDGAEVIAERLNYLLFDRMVAFHVQRGVAVPLSAAEFYAGLNQRYSERDGMYFLPEQVVEYDKKRLTVREILQLQLFVVDELSSIQWLKQQLLKKPQTFQELHPQYLKEISGWQKHEKRLELSTLLDQNFLCYDGKGEVPNQVHSYLSTNYKDLRNLKKDDYSLISKGKNRWYVPDPNKAGDLEKVREKSLMKEFDEYQTSNKKKLKEFRIEAVRAGFKKAWQERDYETIIAVAEKIPKDTLQEDPKLLMWYDQALTRIGDV